MLPAHWMPQSNPMIPSFRDCEVKNGIQAPHVAPNSGKELFRHNLNTLNELNQFGASKKTGGVTVYGYRHYSPKTGQFLGRDPIQERGGMNLYGFVGNDGLGRIDLLGLIDKYKCEQLYLNIEMLQGYIIKSNQRLNNYEQIQRNSRDEFYKLMGEIDSKIENLRNVASYTNLIFNLGGTIGGILAGVPTGGGSLALTGISLIKLGADYTSMSQLVYELEYLNNKSDQAMNSIQEMSMNAKKELNISKQLISTKDEYQKEYDQLCKCKK